MNEALAVAGAVRRSSVRRRSASGVVRTSGLVALAACVGASAWIVLGAADGKYLLELPNGANPPWVDGPLHGLTGTVGSLGSNGLSAALIVIAAGYLVALGCARTISLRTAMVAIVLANLAFTLGPTIVSSDVFGYIAYARESVSHGLNPYVSAPISLGRDPLLQLIYWKHQPSPYGPLFTVLSAPLGLLSTSAALWIYKAAGGLASLAMAHLVGGIAARRGLDPARAAIFVGLNPVLLFYAVSGAHNDLFAALLVVLAFVLTLRGIEAAGAAVAVAAAAIKLTAGLALPFVLIASVRRGQASKGAALAIGAIGVPAVALFGLHFFDQLHRISTDPLFDTVFSGPDRLASLLGSHISGSVRALCTGAAGVAVLIAFVWSARGADAITAAGWAFLALIASIASLAPWYIVWLLPLAALSASKPLRLATLLASAYLLIVHLPALGGVPWLSQAGTAGAGVSRIATTAPTPRGGSPRFTGAPAQPAELVALTSASPSGERR